jgi:hypothetical protein
MRFVLVCVLLLVSLVGAEAPKRTRVLLLAVGVRSGVVDPKLFLRLLEQQVEQKAQQPLNLVAPNADDPRLQGLDLSKTPSLADSLAAAERFQADYVVTLDVHFEDRVEKTILTVVGGALVTVDSLAKRSREFCDPLVFHSELAAPEGEALTRQREDLTARSAHDLADAIIVQTRAKR